MTKNYRFAVIAVIALLQPVHAAADHLCRTELSYTWVPVERRANSEEKSKENSENSGEKKSPEAGGGGEESLVEGKKQTVHFGVIERMAATPEEAKDLLVKAAERQKIRASEICRRDHEAVSGCIASALTVNQSTLNGLGFDARRNLEKSIFEQCDSSSGRCLGVVTSEPVCVEKVVKTPEAAAPAADDGKGKDAKKKK